MPSRSYPGHDAALHHAATEPSLHRRHTWEAAGCTGRPEKGHRHRGAQHLEPASVVEAGRVAASRATRLTANRPGGLSPECTVAQTAAVHPEATRTATTSTAAIPRRWLPPAVGYARL